MSAVHSKMSNEQAVTLVRNALIVAGEEMGEGDHWPAVKSAVYSLAKDFENYKIQNNVFAEVKSYYEGMMKELDSLRKDSPLALKIEIDNALVELKEIYDACFGEVKHGVMAVNEDMWPDHIKRAKAIIDTLENDNG